MHDPTKPTKLSEAEAKVREHVRGAVMVRLGELRDGGFAEEQGFAWSTDAITDASAAAADAAIASFKGRKT